MSNQGQIPAELFKVLNKGGVYQGIEFKGFNFDVDLCATEENSRCRLFYKDYLKDRYPSYKMKIQTMDIVQIESAFMNPPFSNPKPFIEKAWEDSKHFKIVCLVKCAPSTQWWGTFWNYNEVVREFDCVQCHGTGKSNRVFGVDCWMCKGAKVLSYVAEHVGPKPGCTVMFFPKRIKFELPQELINSAHSSALLIFDRRI